MRKGIFSKLASIFGSSPKSSMISGFVPIPTARIIALQEIIWAGQAFLKGSQGISGAIWPMFFTAFYYLIFNGILTVLLGKLEKKLEYFN